DAPPQRLRKPRRDAIGPHQTLPPSARSNEPATTHPTDKCQRHTVLLTSPLHVRAEPAQMSAAHQTGHTDARRTSMLAGQFRRDPGGNMREAPVATHDRAGTVADDLRSGPRHDDA